MYAVCGFDQDGRTGRKYDCRKVKHMEQRISIDPQELNKSMFRGREPWQYWLLRREHLEYVAECMETNYVEVSKMTAYLQTALYNAPNTYHNSVAQKSRAEEKKPYVSEYAEKKEKQIKKIARLREKDRSEYRTYLNRVHEHITAGGNGLVDID